MKTDTTDQTDSRKREGHTDDLDAGKDAVAEAYAKLMEAKAHFRKAAEAAGVEFKDEALERVHKGGENLEAVGAQIASSTQKNPLAALGIAFVVGILFSKVISHK